MRSRDIVTTELPRSGMWTTRVVYMIDPHHELVLQWCAYLDFEDVMRIDYGSIDAALNDPARAVGKWRIVFGDGRLSMTIVPGWLVRITKRYILECARVSGISARHDAPVFSESYGEPITRVSLFDSIRRALALIRLSDTFLTDVSTIRCRTPSPASTPSASCSDF